MAPAPSSLVERGHQSLAQVGQPRIAAHGEGQDGDRKRATRSARARILAASARVSGDGSRSSSRPSAARTLRTHERHRGDRPLGPAASAAGGGRPRRPAAGRGGGAARRPPGPSSSRSPRSTRRAAAGRGAPQRLPPAIEPLLELGRGALHVQPVEEGAAIQGERALRVAALQARSRSRRRSAVRSPAPRSPRRRATRGHGSEPLAEKRSGERRRAARACSASVGPEEGEERARVKPSGVSAER